MSEPSQPRYGDPGPLVRTLLMQMAEANLRQVGDATKAAAQYQIPLTGKLTANPPEKRVVRLSGRPPAEAARRKSELVAYRAMATMPNMLGGLQSVLEEMLERDRQAEEREARADRR